MRFVMVKNRLATLTCCGRRTMHTGTAVVSAYGELLVSLHGPCSRCEDK